MFWSRRILLKLFGKYEGCFGFLYVRNDDGFQYKQFLCYTKFSFINKDLISWVYVKKYCVLFALYTTLFCHVFLFLKPRTFVESPTKREFKRHILGWKYILQFKCKYCVKYASMKGNSKRFFEKCSWKFISEKISSWKILFLERGIWLLKLRVKKLQSEKSISK